MYVGCIYWQPSRPTEDYKKNIFQIFGPKKIKTKYIKIATVFFCNVCSRADLSFSRADLNAQVNRKKTQTKSIANHVRSNHFYWAFYPVDPRLYVKVVDSPSTDFLQRNVISTPTKRDRCVVLFALSHRCNNRRDRGRLVPQLLGWRTSIYWSAQTYWL